MNNRLIIRVTKSSLLFAVADPAEQNKVAFEPYIMKSGISLAANLREAFRTSDLLNRDYEQAMLEVNTPTMLVPIQEFDEQSLRELYNATFTGYESYALIHQVLPHLNAIVAFAVNKDLRLVVEDHFTDVRFQHVMQPVWSHMLNRSFTGTRRKLYAYFHDKYVDVFSFDKNRFRFSNRFEMTSVNDAVYHILHVWKTIGMDAQSDELYLCFATMQQLNEATAKPAADAPAQTMGIVDLLRRYASKTYTINPSAEFNRAPVTLVKGIPFDLMVQLHKA